MFGVSGPIRRMGRMGRTTNPLIDAIAGARWVPRLRRDTVIASSCIPGPKPVVHRSRGTRRRDSTASGDPTVRIPMSWPCVDPSPIWKRSQVACLHGPRVWTIPQRAKEKARILAWWWSSTSSFRRSSLPRWNFYAFGERGELRGPHLALPFIPPPSSLDPSGFSIAEAQHHQPSLSRSTRSITCC